MTGKTVLITGAAKRVGRSIACAVHASGANVMLHYRHAEAEAKAMRAEFNHQRPDSAECCHADLLDLAALTGLVDQTIARFGRLDALINNASSFFPTPLGSIDAAAWDDLVGSNFKAPLFLTQAAAPHLRASRGAVVNITDIHAERSGHSRGSTLDVTLVNLATKAEIDMGSGYDLFDTRSWPTDQTVSPAQRDNRTKLQAVMTAHGFRPLAEEWWHFTLNAEPHPETYFDFPVQPR